MTSTVNTANAIVNAATKPATSTTPNSTGSTSSGANTAAASQTSLNNDFQQFLTLLTTQLQNQDPTAPMDTNQITQQIAELSQVQQQIDTNTQLQNLVGLFTANQTTSAASYIGKQVDATGNTIELTGGTGANTSASAALVYNMPTGASSATVTIKDSTGNVVYSGSAPATAGRNQLDWNGANSTTGTTEPDGTYTFTVTALDSTGKTISPAPTTYTTGIVTAIDTVGGVSSLALGNASVPLSSVQAVYTAGTNPGA